MVLAAAGEPADRARSDDARTARTWHAVLVPLVLAAIVTLQLTTVSYHFYFDDYVPFAEIVQNGPRDYTWNLLTATDVTPNWRPLPGLLYLASYEIAGMHAWPVRVLMLAMHAGTAAMLYVIASRALGRPWAGAVAAIVFGLNPSYVGALSQVTTATQVMTGFFLTATLAAAIECARPRAGTSWLWLAAAVALYLLAIASHEGMAIMFPAIALALLLFDTGSMSERLPRATIRSLPFVVAGLVTAVTFTACDCTESDVWGTSYVWNQTQIYLGRLVYPVGLELPNRVNPSHAVGAAAMVVVMLIVVWRGPAIGRVAVLWTLLAVAPHAFIEYFTASRYLYVPAIGYALVVASLAVSASDYIPSRYSAAALAAGGAALVLLGAWFAYQTVEQNQHFADATGDWRQFERDVTAVFPDVPPGTRVEVIGGPFQRYEYQLYILPAFAETLWGPNRSLQDYEPGSLPAEIALAGDNPFVAQYRDGKLTRVERGDGNR